MGRASERETAESTDVDRVHRLKFDVEWPPGHVAAYLVDGPEPVLVDAGAPGEDNTENLRAGLREHGYVPADVDHVVVTHPHTDHVGQVPALLDGDTRLYAPRPVVDQLRRDADALAAGVRETARAAGLEGEQVEAHVERAVDSLERSRRLLPPARVDVAFEFDGPFAVADHAFEPIHTPGHQVHHACFETTVEGVRILFAGDVLVEPFRAAALHVGLDRGADDAVDAFYTAFDRLAGRDVGRVYPGHGPAFDDYEGVLATSRERLDGTVADVERTVGDVGPADPLAVTLARVEELDHPAPLLDTIGALGYLDDRGRVVRESDDGVRLYRRADGT